MEAIVNASLQKDKRNICKTIYRILWFKFLSSPTYDIKGIKLNNIYLFVTDTSEICSICFCVQCIH